MGLYRDKRLMALYKVNCQKTDKIRKKMLQVFKYNGFSIDMVKKLVVVNFLDV